MHLFGGNLCPQLWEMTVPGSETPFELSAATRASISKAVSNSSSLLPSTFEGRLIGKRPRMKCMHSITAC